MASFRYDITNHHEYVNFGSARSDWRISNVDRVANNPFHNILRQTLRNMLLDHMRVNASVLETDIIHMKLIMPAADCDFAWSRHYGGRWLTVRDMLRGQGLDIVLEFFAKKIQSNKNCSIEPGTIVQIKTYDVNNQVTVNAPPVYQNL